MRKRNIISYFLALGFILGSYHGQIALWNDDCDTPLRIFPYATSSLPLSDQLDLEEGIRLTHYGDLMKLLEDYLS